MTELEKLIRDLGQSTLSWELAVLLACLAAAYGICWAIGRHAPKDSIWFGRFIVDGVLFPLLALAFVYSARIGILQFQKVPLLRIAVPVLVSLAGIRLIARVFTVVFPRSGAARLVERLFSWLAWAAAVLWIVGLLPVVLREMAQIQFAFGKTRLSLLDLVEGVLASGVVLVLALWVSATVERRVLASTVTDLSLRKVATNAIRSTLLLIGFLFVLSAVGVDLTALSVLGGALGVGLGFGLQKLASNYVSGFVILFERSLRIGDTVKVDNFEGVIADIKTRYTLIRAGSGREAIVPNEKLIVERVENLSRAQARSALSTDIGVGYDSDVDAVQRVLVEAAAGTGRVLKDPVPICRLVSFGADALQFTVLFWTDEPAGSHPAIRSDVNLRILAGLRAAGIDIPYPQRVVRVVAPGSDALTSSGTAATD